MYDILIKNGIIIDGTGEPKFRSDIGIKEGEIKEIGNLQNETADQTIDADGFYVAPGFIDVDNHSDVYWRIFSNPDLESLLYQGITTIIGGNCGSSLAPLASHEAIYSIQKWADLRNINLNWLSMREYLDTVKKLKLSVNFATLTGHSTVRRGIIRDEVKNLNSGEFEKMAKMLKSSIKDGSLGISFGLSYTHAKTASRKEISELVQIVQKTKRISTFHLRDEYNNFLESLEEIIEIAKFSGSSVHISHLKALGEKNWVLFDDALDMIEVAGNHNVDITFDVYPYTFTGTVLYILLPEWVSKGGKKMMLRRLNDLGIRSRVIEEMQKSEFDYSKISVSISSLSKSLSRMRIIDIAKSQKKSVEEVLVDLLIASDARAMVFLDALSEKNVEKAVLHPNSIISSNGSGYNISHRKSGDLVHPRSFGTFPRILAKYIQEKRVMSWEEAIYKMSGKPAVRFGIFDRGTIQRKKKADVVIFNPDTIKDLATWNDPYQYSAGVNFLIINGKLVVKNEKYNGKRAGEVLRNFL